MNTHVLDSLLATATAPAPTTHEAKQSRLSALASNVIAEAINLEGRVVQTDDDARRRDMILALLQVEPTFDPKAEHMSLKSNAQTPHNSGLDGVAAALRKISDAAYIRERQDEGGRVVEISALVHSTGDA